MISHVQDRWDERRTLCANRSCCKFILEDGLSLEEDNAEVVPLEARARCMVMVALDYVLVRFDRQGLM